MPRNKERRFIIIAVTIALTIKLSLFIFAAIHAPQGKLLPDSETYLKTASIDMSKGAFPESESAASQTVSIPLYPELGQKEQEFIVEKIRKRR